MSRSTRQNPGRGQKVEDPHRTISCLLFMDIKGYSSLSDTNLNSFITNFLPGINSSIEKFKYEYINTWGDAIVITSVSVRDIVQIALVLRDFFNNFDWEKYSLPSLSARFSLHQGSLWSGIDFFTSRTLIAGQAVNLAARIEPIVEAGQIWATKDFAQALEREKFTLVKVSKIGVKQLPKNAGTEELYVIYRQKEANPQNKGKEVAIAVVVKNGNVLLVKRIDIPPLEWQFPAAHVKPTQDPMKAAEKAVLDETGVICKNSSRIAERIHPDTDVFCYYYSAEWQDGEAVNRETNENGAVEWVSASEALRRITTDIQPDVRALLEGMKEQK